LRSVFVVVLLLVTCYGVVHVAANVAVTVNVYGGVMIGDAADGIVVTVAADVVDGVVACGICGTDGVDMHAEVDVNDAAYVVVTSVGVVSGHAAVICVWWCMCW